MKDQAKFYVFAGVFGVGILGLLVGIYFWDFAPKAPKPAGDSFVSARNNQATQLPRSVTSTSSDGLHAIVPGRLRVPKKPEPVATRTKTPPESTSRIMPAKPEPVVLKKMNQTLQKTPSGSAHSARRADPDGTAAAASAGGPPDAAALQLHSGLGHGPRQKSAGLVGGIHWGGAGMD